MDLHEALYTTRAMRRVRPDPIPYDVQARILDAAIRAPSGGNQQNWRFLLLDDPDKKAALAPLYQHAMGELWKSVYKDQLDAARADPDAPESVQMFKVQRSAQWLADHFADVPLYLFPFSQHDPTGGSIYPAVWSAMLAPLCRRRPIQEYMALKDAYPTPSMPWSAASYVANFDPLTAAVGRRTLPEVGARDEVLRY